MLRSVRALPGPGAASDDTLRPVDTTSRLADG